MCNKCSDDRRAKRVAGMMSILSNVKSRIEKLQIRCEKKREAELRRCNTDLTRNAVPRDKRPQESLQEQNERLRRELAENTAAQKSLERMFSSLGKEKEIMAGELARRVQEISGLEEHLSDIKAQNELLLGKVQACATKHKERRGSGEANKALQQRNKALSEQLLKSLDGYRALKRKFKDLQEENTTLRARMAQVADEVSTGLSCIQDLRQRFGGLNDMPMDIEGESSAVDHMFKCFEAKLMIAGQKRGECVKPKGDMPAEKSPVLV